jgi:CHAD domain-containing protein
MIMPVREDAPTRLFEDGQRLLERLERAARGTRRRGDPESTHDVRVATRRLEAALDLWRSVLPGRRRRRARRALRALRRDLGPAREVEITLRLLRERFGALAADARIASTLLGDRLQQRAGRLEAQAARRCARRVVRRVRRRFELAWEGVVLDEGQGISFVEVGRARLARRRRRGRAALLEAAEGGINELLHTARVAAKRWRYMLERLAAADPATDTSEQVWLEAVQEALGRIQDLAVLRQRAVRLSPRLAPVDCGGSWEPMRSLLEGLEVERAEVVRKFRRLAGTTARGSPRSFEAGPAA